jgi:lipoprotein-anchoring transpeptidase ErfK/SrfK
MFKREPNLYAKSSGGMAGGDTNPMHVRALHLFEDGRDIFSRIQGTNEPNAFGEAVSRAASSRRIRTP